MFKKFMICLSHPTRIGLYIFEKLRYSILFLLALIVIATIPYGIMLFSIDGFSASTHDTISEAFMTNALDCELKIVDGNFIGTENIMIHSEELVFFLNPKGENFNYQSVETIAPIIEFTALEVKGYFGFSEVFTYSYQELGLEQFDFNTIIDQDYIAYHLLMSKLDGLFMDFKGYVIVTYLILMIFQTLLLLIFSAAVMALIVKMFNSFLPYRLRFKLALDAQVVAVVGVLLTYLFDFRYFTLIGLTLSSVYLILSLRSIVRVEVRKKPKEEE